MHERLIDYSSTRKLPTGRRIFVVQAIRRLAESYGDAEVVGECDAAIAHDRQTRSLELGYEAAKSQSSNARGDAAKIDTRIDATFSGMHSVAQGQAVGHPQKAEKASDFLTAVFPNGVYGLVNLTFEDQLTAEEELLDRFQGDLSDHVDLLGLRDHVDLLGDLVPRFRAELEKENGQKVTYATVKEARLGGLERFAGVIFDVLSKYKRDAAKREALLKEYHRQNQIVADAYRRDEPLDDIDPDTGEPVTDTDEDVVEPVS